MLIHHISDKPEDHKELIEKLRKKNRKEPTVRDWVSCNITLKKGLTGVKPDGFCYWLFDVWITTN